MKFTKSWFALSLLAGALACSPASAGWGLFGHGGGSAGGASHGSSGGAYGSSGGAGYGSSGGAGYAGYGSSGGYASSYGSSGGAGSGGAGSGGAGSVGGSSGGPGFFARIHEKVHSHFAAKHAARAANGSSGGYASHGSSGGSSGYSGYGSSGGGSSGYYSGYSSIGHGSSGGSVSYGSTGSGYGSVGTSSYGSAYYGASRRSPASAASLVSNTTLENDTVQLNVTVPAEATVYVNGRATSSTGEVRNFVSRGLQAGKSYRFEIRAELANGVSDSKAVVVSAGDQEAVYFALSAPVQEPAKIDTAVTLNVPENAEVTLAGSPTKVTGTTRTFRTSQLKSGQVWDDYVIRVAVGDQVKEQSIRLIAGDNLELSFDFADNADRVASR